MSLYLNNNSNKESHQKLLGSLNQQKELRQQQGYDESTYQMQQNSKANTDKQRIDDLFGRNNDDDRDR